MRKVIIEQVFDDYTAYKRIPGKEYRIHSIILEIALCSDVFSIGVL